jgi:RND family efflux transporter MFP subunit
MTFSIPRPRAHLWSRFVLPVAIVLAMVSILLFTLRESLMPAVEVRVAPVVARQVALAANRQHVNPRAEATVLAQAPGWVEPEPYAIIVPSLVEGVVREVNVLEGEHVDRDEVVAALIDEDAVLELERTQAEFDMQAAAVSRAKAEVEAVAARAAEAQDEVDRKRQLVSVGGVSEGDFARLELRLAAFKAEHEIAKAAVSVAEASARRADVMRRQAQLALDRTIIRAPVAGVVLARSVRPGTRISMTGGGPGEAHAPGVISIYNPAKLQVRAEVPLADFGKVAMGTAAEVTTEALPGVTISGNVVGIVHEADIQRNTVQVKVSLIDPPSVLKPDMLTRVRFVTGGGASGASQGSTAETIAATDSYELIVPTNSIVSSDDGSADVWLVSVRGRGGTSLAVKRRVERGAEVEPGFTRILSGLKPGDRVIVDAPDGLADGTRVTAEGGA